MDINPYKQTVFQFEVLQAWFVGLMESSVVLTALFVASTESFAVLTALAVVLSD